MELTPHTTVRELFLTACERQDLKKVRTILTYGADINWRGCHIGWSGLHHAVNNNSEDLLSLALGVCGVDVNCVDNDEESPLMRACQLGHDNLVYLLCQANGIDLNLRDGYGRTALLHAVLEDNVGCVEILRATAGVDWNVRDEDGDSALSIAADQGYAEILQIILSVPEPYLEMTFTDGKGRNIAQIAVETEGAEEIGSANIEGQGTNEKEEVLDGNGNSGIEADDRMEENIVGDQTGHEEKERMEEKVDDEEEEGMEEKVDEEEEEGMEDDSSAEFMECFMMLTEDARVNWNIKNQSGETPLMYCLKNRKIAMSRALLQNPRVDRDTQDKDGNYPENIARKKDLREILDQMWSSGNSQASINCPVCQEKLAKNTEIFQCRQGHFVCGQCRHMGCPTCQEEIVGRAYGFESFLKQMN